MTAMRPASRLLSNLWAVVAAVLVYAAAAAASANEGKPMPVRSIGVDAGSEALGIPSISVVRERLEFDFRPLDASAPPTVRATYELLNEGEAVVVPLVFASFEVGASTVTFDGNAVESQRVDPNNLPRAWSTPDGPVASEVSGRGASGIAFELAIPPGEHVSEVTYEIEGDLASWHSTGHVVRYSFQPASSWKAFRALEVTIHCVEGWQCRPGSWSTTPSETKADPARTDDGLHFEARDPNVQVATTTVIPKESLRILVTRPAPLWLRFGPVALSILGVVLGLVLVFLFARVVLLPSHIGARIAVWMGLSVVTVTAAGVFGATVASAQQRLATQTGGYGSLLTVLGALFVGVLLAAAIPLVAWIMNRRRRPKN